MEGPPLKAIAESFLFLENLGIDQVSGNTKAGKEKLRGKKISRIHTVGKRLVIEAGPLAVVIHFLMFGSYRLNERREGMEPRLSLVLGANELNFYNCSVKIISKKELQVLDESSDILNPHFARQRAMDAIRVEPGLIADLLLDQDLFAGVGNIIKNEALYGADIHPGSIARNIPKEKAQSLIENAIRFSRAFYQVKKVEGQLPAILRIYRKKRCDRCKSQITRKKMGNRKRLTFFCPQCQILF